MVDINAHVNIFFGHDFIIIQTETLYFIAEVYTKMLKLAWVQQEKIYRTFQYTFVREIDRQKVTTINGQRISPLHWPIKLIEIS